MSCTRYSLQLAQKCSWLFQSVLNPFPAQKWSGFPLTHAWTHYRTMPLHSRRQHLCLVQNSVLGLLQLMPMLLFLPLFIVLPLPTQPPLFLRLNPPNRPIRFSHWKQSSWCLLLFRRKPMFGMPWFTPTNTIGVLGSHSIVPMTIGSAFFTVI